MGGGDSEICQPAPSLSERQNRFHVGEKCGTCYWRHSSIASDSTKWPIHLFLVFFLFVRVEGATFWKTAPDVCNSLNNISRCVIHFDLIRIAWRMDVEWLRKETGRKILSHRLKWFPVFFFFLMQCIVSKVMSRAIYFQKSLLLYESSQRLEIWGGSSQHNVLSLWSFSKYSLDLGFF